MKAEAARSDQLELNIPVTRRIEGRDILLVRTEAGVRALEDICPHQKQPLSSGSVKSGQITCRHHGILIDLSSGKVVWSMGFLGLDDVQVFPASEDGGTVFLELDD